jgi:hypothetical protein
LDRAARGGNGKAIFPTGKIPTIADSTRNGSFSFVPGKEQKL